MNKKNLIAICLVLVAIAALAFASRTQSQVGSIKARSEVNQHTEALPEHVTYMFLFHHLKVIKEQGEENERQGKGKSVLLARFYEKASLDENRGQMLLNMALQCERELEEQDRKAQLIINDFRARHFPDGVYRGQGELPPPPPELASMQQERNAIVLWARNRLRGVMGEQDFERLNVFVSSEIAASVKAIKAN